jgi:hypothetical protein
MKRSPIILLFSAALVSLLFIYAKKEINHPAAPRQYMELRIYHTTSTQQMTLVENFLQYGLLPALKKAGVGKTGVFTPVNNDTATDKKIYVLIPYQSLKQLEELPVQLQKNGEYEKGAKEYVDSPYDKPAYSRYETILLHAFENMPQVKASALKGNKKDRIYELRSYESATEKLHQNKVKMFNKGGEVALFDRLGFNAVFYGEVLFGARMPNLMYMTSFENKASRDEHWKTFGNDPTWKELSAKPEYQHNVSKIDIVFLTPSEYSEL